MSRLTASQYQNTLTQVFGTLPVLELETDTNPHLFYSIGATTTTLSEQGVQLYEEAAEEITQAVFLDDVRRDALVGCGPDDATAGCTEAFVERVGRLLYRRPLTRAEQTRWVTVATSSAPTASESRRLALMGLLQSPNFLYRIETGEVDPSDSSRRRFTAFEMASRLSFLFWNSGPDPELLDAASRGETLTDDGIYSQAMRLLESPEAAEAVKQFFVQYLDLERLSTVERDSSSYPLFTDTMAASMRTEVELVVHDLVFRKDADIRSLFNTRNTFVNTDLANLYGVAADGASQVTFVPVELPESGHRAGVLTFGGFLAMNAHATETSPTARGKAVRERVLCQSVPAPPDDVDLNLDPPGAARTLRERLEEHRSNPACASCHAFIDPPGMIFQHFDSIGVYRELEDGLPIDASGEIDGVTMTTAREFADFVYDNQLTADCIVKQLYRHGQGRLDEASEEAALAELAERLRESGYRFQDLMVELAISEGFRTFSLGDGGER